ncbi:MAG: protein-glutamate O-methyltransferase CheR [Flavisolibacter sp.]|nr:protein-glutamate O-methyltransferase CheR [Flavisolibacter sp.]
MVRDEDVQVLLNDMLDVYGYDFNDYSKASLKRRIDRLFTLDKFPSFAEFRYRIKSDEAYLKRFVEEITVNVTEMFRDPSFYQTLQKEVLPKLATYPLIRIWHAGCSTGEEVYSMAILLHEANLLQKSLLYATDLNPDVLEKAKEGIFPLSQMKQYSENYLAAGGKRAFSEYYTSRYDRAKFDKELSRKMIFATHNLVSDRSFNEFQLILCRNVMIYFDKDLQDRVLQLFDQSLEPLGFLGLGSKETIRFSTLASSYKQIGKEKIWRKGA